MINLLGGDIITKKLNFLNVHKVLRMARSSLLAHTNFKLFILQGMLLMVLSYMTAKKRSSYPLIHFGRMIWQ